MNKCRSALAIIATACLTLAGCNRAPDAGAAPLAGAAIGGPFTLTDQDGRVRTDTMFAGQYRLVYFGYTFCPDVCPLDVQHLMAGYHALAGEAPAKAARLAPIFITVDPARDTPAVLRQFVRAFDPKLVGLTGPEREIDAVVKRYGAYRRVEETKPGTDGYLVDHTRNATLFGPDGKPIALIPVDADARVTADEMAKWIA